MPSPFPGMDPYLEDPAFWQDFHRSFITYCRDALLDALPDAYEARIDEQVRLIEHLPGRAADRLPDVSVTRDERRGPALGRGGSVATAEVASVAGVEIAATLMVEEIRDTWIEVLHRPDRSLVTIIEVLSPTNKGVGYWQYRQKRFGIVSQPANLLEIDLLLGGRRIELDRPLPSGDYYTFLTRATRRDVVRVYPWFLRDPLPTVPVPLKSPDPDIGLNIAEVFKTTYERGRYVRSLAYDAPPVCPLQVDQLQWAKTIAATMIKT